MRSDMLLVVLTAVATAHPVAIPEAVRANIPRELQYSDLVAMAGPPSIQHWPGSYYEQDHRSPSQDGRHPHSHSLRGHHNGDASKDILSNIVAFLSHQARSIAEVASGMVHSTRGVLSTP